MQQLERLRNIQKAMLYLRFVQRTMGLEEFLKGFAFYIAFFHLDNPGVGLADG